MEKIDKPKGINNHSERLEEMDAIVEYLLKSCGENATLHQEARHIKTKLIELKSFFDDGETVIVSPYGLVSRQQAKRSGYLDIFGTADTEYPAITGRSFEEVAEQEKAIYEVEREIDALLKRVDEINEKSVVLIDTHYLYKGLHDPKKFNSPDIRKVMEKYPMEVRRKLKELGMKAFLEHKKVPHNDIEEALRKSA